MQRNQIRQLKTHNIVQVSKRFKRQHFKPFLDNSFLVDVRHDEMMSDRLPTSLRLLKSNNQTSNENKLDTQNKLSSDIKQKADSTLNKIKNKFTSLYDKIKTSLKKLIS